MATQEVLNNHFLDLSINMCMELVFIHGANGSAQCWNYIESNLPHFKKSFIEYDSEKKFETNLKKMISNMSTKRNTFIIGHSMGGIYAYYLKHELPKSVSGAVTIATPYGGSAISTSLNTLFPMFCTLWSDSGVHSDVIKKMTELPVPNNWHQIVCTTNRTMIPLEPNDGLITKKSQTKIPGINYIEVDDTHYEVLQSKKVVKHIQNILNQKGKHYDRSTATNKHRSNHQKVL